MREPFLIAEFAPSFDRSDLGKPFIKAQGVLQVVDVHIERTGESHGTLRLYPHHYEWLDAALKRGTRDAKSLATTRYRLFKLVPYGGDN